MVIEIACIPNIENSVCDNKGDMRKSCVSNSQTHVMYDWLEIWILFDDHW